MAKAEKYRLLQSKAGKAENHKDDSVILEVRSVKEKDKCTTRKNSTVTLEMQTHSFQIM